MSVKQTVGIYLAAGYSRRFGGHKLATSFHGEPLGLRALKIALQSKLDYIIVVTNEQDTLFTTFTERSDKWERVICPVASEGQAYSLRYGLERAEVLGAEAILVMLADQPLVTVDMIDRFLDTYASLERSFTYIGAHYLGLVRPPILFPCHMFSHLHRLTGDQGARQIIRNQKNLQEATLLDFGNESLFLDVDTKAELQYLKEKSPLYDRGNEI